MKATCAPGTGRDRSFALPALLSISIALAASCGGDGERSGGDVPGGDGESRAAYELLMNESAGNVFVLDGQNNPALTVPAGKAVTVKLVNTGSAIHNMRFSGIDGRYFTGDDTVSDPEFISPGKKGVLIFTAPGVPGKYLYQCDIHPTDMFGDVIVLD